MAALSSFSKRSTHDFRSWDEMYEMIKDKFPNGPFFPLEDSVSEVVKCITEGVHGITNTKVRQDAWKEFGMEVVKSALTVGAAAAVTVPGAGAALKASADIIALLGDKPSPSAAQQKALNVAFREILFVAWLYGLARERGSICPDVTGYIEEVQKSLEDLRTLYPARDPNRGVLRHVRSRIVRGVENSAFVQKVDSIIQAIENAKERVHKVLVVETRVIAAAAKEVALETKEIVAETRETLAQQKEISLAVGARVDTLSGGIGDANRGIDELKDDLRQIREKGVYSGEKLPKYPADVFREESAIVGREGLLQGMHEFFEGRHSGSMRIFVLSGMAGIGKSSLAKEYARKNMKHYSGGILFCNAEDETVMKNSLVGQNISDLKALEHHASENHGLLLIMDNADKIHGPDDWRKSYLNQIAPFAAHVIITTRLTISNREMKAFLGVVDRDKWKDGTVDALDEESSIRLLRGETPLTNDLDILFRKIVDREHLNGHPLSIVQARAHMEEFQKSPSAFLEALESFGPAGAVGGDQEDHCSPRESVLTSILVSTEALSSSGPFGRSVVALLKLLSWWHPDLVLKKILNCETFQEASLSEKGSDRPMDETNDPVNLVSSRLSGMDQPDLGLQRVIHSACQLCLLSEEDGPDGKRYVRIHRLTQDAMRRAMSETEKRVVFAAVRRYLLTGIHRLVDVNCTGFDQGTDEDYRAQVSTLAHQALLFDQHLPRKVMQDTQIAQLAETIAGQAHEIMNQALAKAVENNSDGARAWIGEMIPVWLTLSLRDFETWSCDKTQTLWGRILGNESRGSWTKSLRRDHENGSLAATYSLGFFCEGQERLDLWAYAAEHGHSGAAFALANNFSDGKSGIRLDVEEAGSIAWRSKRAMRAR